MNIRDILIDKLDKKVYKDIKGSLTRIEVSACVGMFNSMCFFNSVEYAIDNNCQVAEVICIDNGSPNLHYVNIKDGAFLETTLGHRADYLEYYFVRDISPSDFKDIPEIFDRSLDYWGSRYLKWYHRLLNIGRAV